MANVRTGNKFYVDSTGELTSVRTQVAYILFTPANAGDQIVLRESAAGADVFQLQAAVADDTKHFDFSARPIVFPNGIYVQTLTTGAKAVFILTEAGG